MEQLVQMVSEKAGIPVDTARTAVMTVIGFLKDKLPEPIASQLDGFIGGGEAPAEGDGEGGGMLGDIAGRLGGLLGS